MIGHVIRNQVPMLITHDEDQVEYVCEHLAEAMERAYMIYDFFGGDVDDN